MARWLECWNPDHTIKVSIPGLGKALRPFLQNGFMSLYDKGRIYFQA